MFLLTGSGIIKFIQDGYNENIGEILKKEISSIRQEHPKELTILFSNSTNGHLESCDCPTHPYGGLVRRASYINDVRKKSKNLLLLDSGDIFPPYPNKKLVECLLKIYEYMKYDVVGIGDQELSYSDFVKEKDEYNIPFLASNLNYCEGALCNFMTPQEKFIEKAGLKIAILSIVDPDVFVLYPEKFKKKFVILNPDDIISGFIERNKDKYDYLILVSHSGLDRDKIFAEKFPEVDLIIGGHSQNLLQQPHKSGKTLIVQAGPDAQYIGELKLKFDESKKLTSYEHKIVPLTKEIPDDPTVRNHINTYKEKLKSK